MAAADERPEPRRLVVHRKSTPPPPIVAYEDVIAACGHTDRFGLFEDRQDKFRKDRRKKITDRPCRACRETKRLEEEEAARVRKAEKQQRAEQSDKTRAQKKLEPDQGRLPDGSRVGASYDATSMQWSGELTVGESVFTDSAGGLFTLLKKLDQQYRQSLPPSA